MNRKTKNSVGDSSSKVAETVSDNRQQQIRRARGVRTKPMVFGEPVPNVSALEIDALVQK